MGTILAALQDQKRTDGARGLRPEGQNDAAFEGGRERVEAQAAGLHGAFALGLVPYTTSDTVPSQNTNHGESLGFQIDRFDGRARRMRKSLLTGARLHVEESEKPGFRAGWWAMVTLTYRPDSEWSPLQIAAFVKRLREWCKRRSIEARYLWCLELTKAGKTHYHVLIRLPRGMMLPKPDKRGWWTLGMSRIEKAKNAVGYMAKYASKGTAEAMAEMPNGARLHGVGGLSPESRRELRWWRAPKFVREALGAFADLRKARGGYVDAISGEFFVSPWRVTVDGSGRVFAWMV